MVYLDTRIGPYHSEETGNQDCVSYDFISSQYLVIALADGAGSLENSAEGAELSVRTVIESLSSYIESAEEVNLSIALTASVEDALSAVRNLENFSQYGSTLSVFIYDMDNGRWATSCIGDSFIVLEHEDGRLSLETGNSGEYANITELTTSKNACPTQNSGTGIIGVALASDGMGNVSLSKGNPFAPFWTHVFNSHRDETLNIGRIFNQMQRAGKFSDDTTLAVETFGFVSEDTEEAEESERV